MNKIIITAAFAAATLSAKAQCKCFEEIKPLEVWSWSKTDSTETLKEPTGDQFTYTLFKEGDMLVEGEPITTDSITTTGDTKKIIYGEYYKMELTIYYNMFGTYEGHRFKEVLR
jgi:aconitase A